MNVNEILNGISKIYWEKMWKYISDNEISPKDVNCLILNPESIIFYFGEKYIAIEYCGNQFLSKISNEHSIVVKVRDYTKEHLTNKQFLDKIIGFEYDGTSSVHFSVTSGMYEDLVVPTNKGIEKLLDLKWNFEAQSSIMGINTNGLDIADNQFVRLINCRFFDEHNGDLKTRIIKWIDFIPCVYEEPKEGDFDIINVDIKIFDRLWKSDLKYKYPRPNDFKYAKLPQINKFIEIFSDSKHSEPEITGFLAEEENKFILRMAFMGTDIYNEVICKWQSEKKDDLRPDFFVKRANGYADIVEFKLQNVRSKTIVGRANREHFSSEINTYIAQTRKYCVYFDDPNNRNWFEREYGYKVYKPRRYLVIGRRNDFASDEWVEIKSDYSDLELITYDDLVDTVMSQFYS